MKGSVTTRRKPIDDKKPFIVTDQMLALSGPSNTAVQPFAPAEHPPGVAPSVTMAMDDSLASPLSWAEDNTGESNG